MGPDSRGVFWVDDKVFLVGDEGLAVWKITGVDGSGEKFTIVDDSGAELEVTERDLVLAL